MVRPAGGSGGGVDGEDLIRLLPVAELFDQVWEMFLKHGSLNAFRCKVGGAWDMLEFEGDPSLVGLSAEDFTEDPGLWVSRMHPDDLRHLPTADEFRQLGVWHQSYRWRGAGGYHLCTTTMSHDPSTDTAFGLWITGPRTASRFRH